MIFLLPAPPNELIIERMIDLTSQFPTVSLAALPTPLRALKSCGDAVFMKEDGLSGAVYGGNKIRKLEFLLGEAVSEGRKTVITYGAAGSNHALATAVCCRELGLHAVPVLAPQPTSEHVRRNLLLQQAVGAELHLCEDYTRFPAMTEELIARYRRQDGMEPYIIPAGGSNAVGALGFVQAAFEMAEQLRPDIIYIPMGTGGTLAGLLVGLRLARLDTRIEAVRVVQPAFRSESHVKTLCDELCDKLGSPRCTGGSDITIRDEFFGPDYGIATPESREAVAWFIANEGVSLENTYTGKTVAALLHDLRSGALDGKTVLYWNTLNARDFSADIADVGYRELPPAFHAYF